MIMLVVCLGPISNGGGSYLLVDSSRGKKESEIQI